MGTSAFYMRNPFKIHLNHKQIVVNFTKEIPLKLNRTKKKVYQKIELTFNFTKEIHVKIIRNEKKSTLNLVSKIPSRIVKLEKICEKSRLCSVILKILGPTPQLVQHLTPIRKFFCTFLYQCCYYPTHPLQHIQKQKNLKDQKWITFTFTFHFHFFTFHFH